MVVLKIIGVLAVIVSILVGTIFFNEHCNEKFSYRFFTKVSFVITALGLWAILGGQYWYEKSLASAGDTLNGIVLVGLGIFILCFLVYYNFKRTNLLYGMGGSALQLSLFGFFAYLGAFVLLAGLILSFLAMGAAKPVYIVNK